MLMTFKKNSTNGNSRTRRVPDAEAILKEQLVLGLRDDTLHREMRRQAKEQKDLTFIALMQAAINWSEDEVPQLAALKIKHGSLSTQQPLKVPSLPQHCRRCIRQSRVWLPGKRSCLALRKMEKTQQTPAKLKKQNIMTGGSSATLVVNWGTLAEYVNRTKQVVTR